VTRRRKVIYALVFSALMFVGFICYGFRRTDIFPMLGEVVENLNEEFPKGTAKEQLIKRLKQLGYLPGNCRNKVNDKEICFWKSVGDPRMGNSSKLTLRLDEQGKVKLLVLEN
jgi:hypothetical protein